MMAPTGLAEGSEESVEHAARVVADLPAGDRHHRDPVGVQLRDLEPVALERDPARVGVLAVDLDHEAAVAPEEVDLVAVDADVGLIAGDLGRPEEAQHPSFGR